MARTIDQWHSYVKSLLPGWRNGNLEESILWGMARVFKNLEDDVAFAFSQTFIESASGARLEIMGFERGVEKLPGEQDELYRDRIRSFTGVIKSAIQLAISSAIISVIGVNSGIQYALKELAPGPFCEHDFIDTFFPSPPEIHYNTFMIEFIGNRSLSLATKNQIYEATILAVNKARAFGVFFDITSTL